MPGYIDVVTQTVPEHVLQIDIKLGVFSLTSSDVIRCILLRFVLCGDYISRTTIRKKKQPRVLLKIAATTSPKIVSLDELSRRDLSMEKGIVPAICRPVEKRGLGILSPRLMVLRSLRGRVSRGA